MTYPGDNTDFISNPILLLGLCEIRTNPYTSRYYVAVWEHCDLLTYCLDTITFKQSLLYLPSAICIILPLIYLTLSQSNNGKNLTYNLLIGIYNMDFILKHAFGFH